MELIIFITIIISSILIIVRLNKIIESQGDIKTELKKLQVTLEEANKK